MKFNLSLHFRCLIKTNLRQEHIIFLFTILPIILTLSRERIIAARLTYIQILFRLCFLIMIIFEQLIMHLDIILQNIKLTFGFGESVIYYYTSSSSFWCRIYIISLAHIRSRILANSLLRKFSDNFKISNILAAWAHSYVWQFLYNYWWHKLTWIRWWVITDFSKLGFEHVAHQELWLSTFVLSFNPSIGTFISIRRDFIAFNLLSPCTIVVLLLSFTLFHSV